MLVDVGDVLRQTQVSVGIRLVLDEPQQVEAGQQGGRQLNVGLDALPGIVAAVGGVGRSEDGAASVEGGHDAGLHSEAEMHRDLCGCT